MAAVTTIRVPASSANLGPGFDALGLALDLHLVCRFRQAQELRISVGGPFADGIPCNDSNLIWQTAISVGVNLGRTLPPIELTVENGIPLGKGLGSSAAALTAGVIIADHLLGLGWKPARVLDEAARIEGHPDNVAACVLGAIVTSAIDSGGVAHAVRLELHERFDVGIVVPDFHLPTAQSRAVLPECLTREDAVFNVQRSALLIAALVTGTTSAFPAALEDRLHQPYRAPLVPGLEEILKLRAPGLLGCALSGAGPSIVVFYEKGSDAVCKLVQQLFALRGCQSEILVAGISRSGYHVMTEEI